MPKNRPILDEMPWNIKEKILNLTSSTTAIELSHCSKEFRHIFKKFFKIRTWPKLSLILGADKVILIWKKYETKSVKVTLKPHKNGYLIRNEEANFVKIVGIGDYRKAAVAKLLAVFKDSRMDLKELFLGTDYLESRRIAECDPGYPKDWKYRYTVEKFEEDKKTVLDEFQRAPFKLPIKNLHSNFPMTPDEVFRIMSLLDCQTIKSVELKQTWPLEMHENGCFVSKIMKINQWKSIKRLVSDYKIRMNRGLLEHLDWMDLSNVSHLGGLRIQDIVEIFMSKPTSHCFTIHCSDYFDEQDLEEYWDEMDLRTYNQWRNEYAIKDPRGAFRITMKQGTTRRFQIERIDPNEWCFTAIFRDKEN